jgi:SAM-dependent methyltransferase
MNFTLLACPVCKSNLHQHGESLICVSCGRQIPLQSGKPIFTNAPAIIQPFEKIERGPDKGTPWRKANWRFLESVVSDLPENAFILDVGAGHGDFAQIFTGRNYTSLDVVPYAEVDLVCDLTQQIPFPPGLFDVVILMNVLEHVYAFDKLMSAISYLLKLGGRLIMAVPFMIKIHQPPFDFYRYTHFALPQIGADAGLKLDMLEGYYDTVFFIGEGFRNLQFWGLPVLTRPRRILVRGILLGFKLLLNALSLIVPRGFTASPEKVNNPAVIGYHLVFSK